MLIPFGFLGGSISVTQLFGLLTSGIAVGGSGISIDSGLNIYVSGSTTAKYNSTGVLQWQRTLNGSGGRIAADASGNLAMVQTFNTTGSNDWFTSKRDSSGALQWQRRYGDGTNEIVYDVAVDSSSNIYSAGRLASGLTDFNLVKYNSSGTLQWQRRIDSGGSGDQWNGVTTDSSGNVYTVGSTRLTGAFNAYAAKYNSSGTLQWQRRLDTPYDCYGNGIAVDSSGNAYLAIESQTGSYRDITIVKYDTSGTLLWQKTLYSADSESPAGVAVDTAGNVYVVGYNNTGSGNNHIAIGKFNSSGTLQWQRTISTSGVDTAQAVSVDTLGNLYLVGTTTVTGTSAIFVAILPTDGSKTGTYSVGASSFTYAAGSMGQGSQGFGNVTATGTATTPTTADNTATLTDAASSLTWTKTNL
jgi:hypothetical protein